MMDISQKIKLSFPRTGTEITAEKDETLLDAARRGNIQIPAACSREGHLRQMQGQDIEGKRR